MALVSRECVIEKGSDNQLLIERDGGKNFLISDHDIGVYISGKLLAEYRRKLGE